MNKLEITIQNQNQNIAALEAALEEKASEQGCFLWAGIKDEKPVAYYI
jgi:hypothetical protein|nr:MAG TPA: hypothetical protein [Caudoviricetes sp.]